MQIDNLIINSDLSEVLVELRSQLNANGKHLLEKFIDSGDDIMVQCPYHKEGQERRPSAGIRKSDGMFHCLACGETHSLPEVVSYCFGHKDTFFGYKWLAKNFSSVEVSNRPAIELDFGVDNKEPIDSGVEISEEELDSYRYTHQYMYDRGLTDEIIEEFDIGYDKKCRCITFPVRDRNGKCTFIVRRNVAYKRFDIPKGVDKPLYGLYEIYKHQSEISEVYVCEGPFDCLRLWCNGKYAVAGFGCLFSDKQIAQLRALPVRKLIIALDNDIAGQVASDKLKARITDKIVMSAIIPKWRKDIGECTDEEIQNLQEEF